MADINSLKEEYRSNLTQCIQRVKTELDNKASADDLTELQSQVNTITVADVPVTDLTWADTTHFESSFTRCKYQVKNGVCFVNIDMTCNSPIAEGYELPITLPTPNTEYVHHRVSSFQSTSSVTIAVSNSGISVIVYGGLKGDRYLGSFSYPVAES